MPKILVFASVLDSSKQALFLFSENIFIHGQKFLITPRGRCVYFAHEARCATSPPSHTLPPSNTYLLGRRYQCLPNALFQPRQCNYQCRNGCHRLSQSVISLNNQTRGGTKCRSNSRTKITRNSMSSASAGPAALIPITRLFSTPWVSAVILGITSRMSSIFRRM